MKIGNETKNYESILNIAKKNRIAIDMHDDNKRIKIKGIALLKNGGTVALIDSKLYCLNALYMSRDRKKLLLSTLTIGDMMLDNDIDSYNYRLGQGFNGSKIDRFEWL